jgi:hypothetical protein
MWPLTDPSPLPGLVLMTGPFQTVLGQIPKGVLAGLFWYMGTDALWTSGVTAIFFFLIKDRHLTPADDPFHQVRKSRLWVWLLIELLGFAATFAITNTIAAIVSVFYVFLIYLDSMG